MDLQSEEVVSLGDAREAKVGLAGQGLGESRTRVVDVEDSRFHA
jgi:hypothetical protein